MSTRRKPKPKGHVAQEGFAPMVERRAKDVRESWPRPTLRHVRDPDYTLAVAMLNHAHGDIAYAPYAVRRLHTTRLKAVRALEDFRHALHIGGDDDAAIDPAGLALVCDLPPVGVATEHRRLRTTGQGSDWLKDRARAGADVRPIEGCHDNGWIWHRGGR